jgi:UDP-N-acetylglucosamine acyltransferase
MSIHPSAIIDSHAKIASDVIIGAYSIIGPDVTIESHCIIEPHVVIKGPTHIARHNHIYQFASVGEATPDLKYKGEKTTLTIGEHNVIREGVTIHRGTVQDRGETSIGNDNLIMAYTHIGHDSVIGNHCVLVNNTALAGHVHIGDWAILSGYTLVHQYCHIGTHAFTGMGSAIGKDVPAYVMVTGAPAKSKTINTEGLQRRGFSKMAIQTLQKAFKVIYRKKLILNEAMIELEALATDCAEVRPLIDSIQNSTRGIVR